MDFVHRRGLARRLVMLLVAVLAAVIGGAAVPAPAQAGTFGTITWPGPGRNDFRCVAPQGGSNADGTKLVLASCNGVPDWTLYRDGTIRIMGKCLVAGPGTIFDFRGVDALLWTCGPTTDRWWTPVSINNYNMIRRAGNRGCLIAANAIVGVVDCTDVYQERFQLPVNSFPEPVMLPATLNPVRVAGSSVSLTWTDRSFDESAFQVYRRVGNGPLQAVSDLITARNVQPQGDTYAFVDTGPPSGRLCYEISNQNAAGTLVNYSSEVCTSAPVLPPAPAFGTGTLSAPQPPGPGGFTGGTPSVAVGSDGLGIISYTAQAPEGTGWKLTVGHCQNPNCTTVVSHTIDTLGNNGDFSSIKIGSDGLPLISYTLNDDPETRAANDLRVAHCVDVACTSATLTTVDTAAYVNDTALAIGADGLGVIAYYDDAPDGPDTKAKVAHCADLACTSATVRTVDTIRNNQIYGGAWVSIAASPAAGGPVLAYVDLATHDLKVTACRDATCASAVTSTVDDGLVGDSPAITVGLDGLPLISYGGWPGESFLKVAHCVNLLCTAATKVIADNRADTGYYTTITIGADGLGLIGYYDAANGDADVAHCADLACGTVLHKPIATDGDQGSGGDSVAIGPDGLPLVAFYDVTNGQLKIAHCADAACAATLSAPSVTTPPDMRGANDHNARTVVRRLAQ